MLCEFYSGMASPFEVAQQFDKLCEWGGDNQPDFDAFDPTAPATPAEKAAAAPLLSMAGGDTSAMNAWLRAREAESAGE